LNANGKIDRIRLLEYEIPASTVAAYVPPSSPLQRIIAEIWQTQLEVDNIGLDHNFFAMGGHSLSAIRCLAKLNVLINDDISFQATFQYQTVRDLAKYIENRKTNLPISKTASIESRAFLFPAAGLGASHYVDLLMQLEDCFPIEVLSYECEEPTDNIVQRIAKELATRILAHRSSPTHFILIGHCFGGSVAFELGNELQSAGCDVRLILVDASLVSPSTLSLSRYAAALTHEVPKTQALECITEESSFSSETNEQAMFSRLLTQAKNQLARHIAMFDCYKPSGKFTGSATFIYARNGDLIKLWREAIRHETAALFVQQPIECEIAGDHLSIINPPYVKALAALILQRTECA
jgi:thioesterase domain-containing protein/acyl carrier protein